MLLELAAVIGNDWENVAINAFYLDLVSIHDIKYKYINTPHLAAFEMLLAVKKRDCFKAKKVMFYYEKLRSNQFDVYATSLLLISSQPSPRDIGIPMLYTTLFPDEEAARKFAEGIQNIKLFALYLGLDIADISDLMQGSADNAALGALREFRRLMGFLGKPELLPTLIMALYRADSSDILFNPEYITLQPNLARIARTYLQTLSTAERELRLSAQGRGEQAYRQQRAEPISLKPVEISDATWKSLKGQRIPESFDHIIDSDIDNYQQWLVQLSIQNHDLFIQVAQQLSLIQQTQALAAQSPKPTPQQPTSDIPGAAASGQAQAYELLDDELICSICCYTFTAPVSTNCGHTFCCECLDRLMASSSQSSCPNCRKLITSSVKNSVLSNVVAKLYTNGRPDLTPATAGARGSTTSAIMRRARAKLRGGFTDEDLHFLASNGFLSWHKDFIALNLRQWRVQDIKDKFADPWDRRYASLSFINAHYGENAKMALYQHCAKKQLGNCQKVLADHLNLTGFEQDALRKEFEENPTIIKPASGAIPSVTPGLSATLTEGDLWGLVSEGFGRNLISNHAFELPYAELTKIKSEHYSNLPAQVHALLQFVKGKHGANARKELYKTCVKSRLMEDEDILAKFFKLDVAEKKNYYKAYE